MLIPVASSGQKLAAAAPAAIELVSVQTNFGANNTTPFTLTVPSGVEAGDVLLIFITESYKTPNEGAALAISGLTFTQEVAVSVTDLFGYCYSRTATGTDASTVITFTPDFTCKSGVCLAVYRNATLEEASGNAANSSNMVAPSRTAVADDSELVCWFGQRGTSPAAFTPPGSMVEEAEVATTGGAAVRGELHTQTVDTGATGTRTAVGATLNGHGISVLLTPTG